MQARQTEGVSLFTWWKNLGLQARFMLITSVGLLGVAVCVMVVVGWFEVAKVEQKLRDASESELKSLNALVSSAMEQRANDTQDVAITVFNRWFDHRNVDYPGKLWSVWSPQMAAFMAADDAGVRRTSRPRSAPASRRATRSMKRRCAPAARSAGSSMGPIATACPSSSASRRGPTSSRAAIATARP